jgi:hypothetical protein
MALLPSERDRHQKLEEALEDLRAAVGQYKLRRVIRLSAAGGSADPDVQAQSASSDQPSRGSYGTERNHSSGSARDKGVKDSLGAVRLVSPSPNTLPASGTQQKEQSKQRRANMVIGLLTTAWRRVVSWFESRH